MSTDLDSKSCPKCGTLIPPDALQGLCPCCVMAAVGGATEPGLPGTQRTSAPPDLEAVRTAFPQLEVLELVGVGGMGAVFKVRQPKLDRIAALKILPPEFAASPTFAERFNREARVLARLSHANIVTVFEFGQSGPFFFLLMEFVDGVNLRQAMRAGRFSTAEALGIVPKICDALQYAHDEGVLHRDIKPENILLDARGRVKIADFGIAKLVEDNPADITLTASGARLGTPHYMAPEQVERPDHVDHRADIYSLGVVFYEMLTGELPIGRFAAPSTKTPLDERVDEIVFRALAKERELRQQTAGQMKTEVEGVTHAPSPHPVPGPPLEIPRPRASVADSLRGPWARLGAYSATHSFLAWIALMVVAWSWTAQWPRSAVVGVLGTILGVVAVRRTAFLKPGQTGLPLALFTAVAGPVLILNQALGLFGRPGGALEFGLMFGCILILDVWLVWLAWQGIQKRFRPATEPRWSLPMLTTVLLAILVLGSLPAVIRPSLPGMGEWNSTVGAPSEIDPTTGLPSHTYSLQPPDPNGIGTAVPPTVAAPPVEPISVLPPASPVAGGESVPINPVATAFFGPATGLPIALAAVPAPVVEPENQWSTTLTLKLKQDTIALVDFRPAVGNLPKFINPSLHIIRPRNGTSTFTATWTFSDEVRTAKSGTEPQLFLKMASRVMIEGESNPITTNAGETIESFEFPVSHRAQLEIDFLGEKISGHSTDSAAGVAVYEFGKHEGGLVEARFDIRPRETAPHKTQESQVWILKVSTFRVKRPEIWKLERSLAGMGTNWLETLTQNQPTDSAPAATPTVPPNSP